MSFSEQFFDPVRRKSQITCLLFFWAQKLIRLLWSKKRRGKRVSFEGRSTPLESLCVEEFIEPGINQNGVQTRKILLLQQGLSSRFSVWRRKTTGIAIPAIPALFQAILRLFQSGIRSVLYNLKLCKIHKKYIWIYYHVLQCYMSFFIP